MMKSYCRAVKLVGKAVALSKISARVHVVMEKNSPKRSVRKDVDSISMYVDGNEREDG